MNVQNQRFDVDFPWPPHIRLLPELRRLSSSLETRLSGLEALSGSFEEAVQQFEELGLSRLNDVLTPLASQAIERLQNVSRLFSATSTTEITLATGQHIFVIPVDQRDTYVATPYLGIYAVQPPGNPAAGMIAHTISLDRDLGFLTVEAILLVGAGTFSNWEITVSPSPSLIGYTAEEADAAIDAAIAIYAATVTTLLAAKAPLNTPTLVNPTFTGTPVTSTPSPGDDTNRVPTTSFVRSEAQDIVDEAIAALPQSALDEATVAEIRGATQGGHDAITTDQLVPACAPVALTPAANVGLDWNTGINFTLAINQNSVLSNPSNGQPGTWRTLLVTQDANGTRTLGYGNQYVGPGGDKPVLTTGSGATSRISIFCRTTSIFEVYGIGMGLA